MRTAAEEAAEAAATEMIIRSGVCAPVDVQHDLPVLSDRW